MLSGDAPWCRATAQDILATVAPQEPVLWISDAAPAGIAALAPGKAHGVLGSEYSSLVFDALEGFDADAFGAVSGALCAGGSLLLLLPAPAEIGISRSRFLARLWRVLRQDEHAMFIMPGMPLPALPSTAPAPRPAASWRTEDQQRAVDALMKVVTGHRRRPLVITSDRGRGKSAALGIAAAQLMRKGTRRILVTAPRLDAAEAVFRHAHAELPGSAMTRGRVCLGDAVLEFVAPDDLILTPRESDLLLVDEAAAIPAALLERLLMRHARIAFATTVHGYEGTGRGFALRFYRTLVWLTPGWKSLRLETPIRWPADDPLERLTFRALLLDAATAPEAEIAGATVQSCTAEALARDALAQDEAALGELFGLLVLAHYRTRPADLRHLLDDPAVTVYAMRHGGHIVATALVAAEGGFDAGLARAIAQGRRRPHGHLIAQSLAVHAGLEQAPGLRYGRVMRIAVHPALQGRGLGTRLIGDIAQDLATRGMDGIGASFGASVAVLRFWQRCGMLPVRLGLTREHTSGTHSAIVLRGLSDAGRELYASARQRFGDYLPPLLSDALRELEPALAAFLLSQEGTDAVPALSEQEWRDVIGFAFALRGYEVSMVAVDRLARTALGDGCICGLLDEAHRDLLVARVVQKRGWSDSARQCGFSGRAQALDALRRVMRALVLHYGDEEVRAQVRQVERDMAGHLE